MPSTATAATIAVARRFDSVLKVFYKAGPTPQDSNKTSIRLDRLLAPTGFKRNGGGWKGTIDRTDPKNPQGTMYSQFFGGDTQAALAILRASGMAVTTEVVADSPAADAQAAILTAEWESSPGNETMLAEALREGAKEQAEEMRRAGGGFDTGVVLVEAEDAIKGGPAAMIARLMTFYEVSTVTDIVREAIAAGPAPAPGRGR